MVAMSDFSTFSQMTYALLPVARGRADEEARGKRTGMRSLYFWRMRSASALRFSNGCSSLNLERILGDDKGAVYLYVSVYKWAGESVVGCVDGNVGR